MEQKLLAIVSRRTAWLLLAGCTAFWVVLAAGVLEAPLGTPATLMFLWMYMSLMVALASTLLAAAAVASLVLHRSGTRPVRDGDPGADAAADPGGDAAPVQEPEREDTGDEDGAVSMIRKLLARRG